MTPTRDRAAALRRAAAYIDPFLRDSMLSHEDATLAANELRIEADHLEEIDKRIKETER